MFEDTKAIIWIGGKLGLFKIEDNKVEEFYNQEYSFTKAIEVNNKIYFTTENSTVIQYDIKRKVFNEIGKFSYNDEFLDVAQLNNDELLLICRHSGLIIFNVNNHLFQKPQWAEDPQLKGSPEFIIDKNQGIWIYNHSGKVWYYNQENKIIKKMELISPKIAKIIDLERYNIFIDSKNLIWITTYGNGLFTYDIQTDLLTNYKFNASKNSPASDYLLSITEDNYGNIFIGSEYAGIIKVARSDYDINIIRPEKSESIGKNNNIRTLFKDAYNNIWIGTKNGNLYKYDNDLLKGKCIYEDISPYTLSEDPKNRIWIGTRGNGLYILDNTTMKEVAHYVNDATDEKSLGYNSIYYIFRDNKGRMWLGSFGRGVNLAEENPKGIEFRRFFFDAGSKSYVRYIYQDSKGFIWIGSNGGLIRFNPDELINDANAYISYRMDLNNKNGLNCNDVKTIYEDDEGQIWIGTAGGGINKFIESTNNEPEHFIAYTSKNGLSSDFVSGIMEDRDHNLWISTENGINKFDKKTNSFVIYQFSENTYGNHFNENANTYCSDGNMLWGSLDGLLKFNPLSFIPNLNTPPVTLTNFYIYDRNIQAGEIDSPLKKSIEYTEDIKLNYKQNTFTIEYALLDLKDPAKNKYMYMLENYDKHWSSVNHLNTATYKNLSPGNYVFMVKGTNSDGVWNENITKLIIQISPPFWKSWYAYLIYIILILSTIYLVLRVIYKFNVLNTNIKLEKELTNHKLRFFTNISHEFRTPLTLIRGAVENLSSSVDSTDSMKKQIKILNRNSNILTRLIDQLLEFRKLQNNILILDLEEIDIIEFSKEIYSNFLEVATQKNIDYLFISDLDSFKMYIDRRKVDKILYNLLSNAFKFTPTNGKIELIISFNDKNQTCKISVKDNGLGIDKDKQHLLFSRFMQINFSSSGTGVGLSLVKEFVDVHKGKIWYENNEIKGSIFNVELSTSKEIYDGENFIVHTNRDIVSESENNIEESYGKINIANLPEIDDSTLSNYKMLIIDDNEDIRNFLTDEFSKYFMVEEAENGSVGLDKAIKSNPDFIICDVMMPELDGFEVTRRLKEDFQTCHIPIILLTAHSSIEHQLEGIKSGADAYIMKPFSLNYLIIRVFKLIEQREQLKKRFSNEYIVDGNLIALTDKDKEFYNKVDKIMEEHIGDIMFSVDKFAELAKMKRTLFYKKIKGITGLSPNEFIKIKRLKRGAELLLQGDLTVSEISYKVGFESPHYFSKCFKEQYNCSPSKYIQPIPLKENE